MKERRIFPPTGAGIPLDLPENRRRLAYSIRAAISFRNISDSKLARRMHVSPNTIGRWLTGKTAPSVIYVIRLGEALDIDPALFANPPAIPEYPIRDYSLSPHPSGK